MIYLLFNFAFEYKGKALFDDLKKNTYPAYPYIVFIDFRFFSSSMGMGRGVGGSRGRLVPFIACFICDIPFSFYSVVVFTLCIYTYMCYIICIN